MASSRQLIEAIIGRRVYDIYRPADWWKFPDYISAAAIKLPNGDIWTAEDHPSAYEALVNSRGGRFSDWANGCEDGFITKSGKFMGRKEAFTWAKEQKQIRRLDNFGRTLDNGTEELDSFDMVYDGPPIVHEAIPSSTLRATDYYHGCPNSGVAEDIIEHGIEPGQITTKSQMTPVANKVYLTPSIAYAQIYAMGANMAGHKLWKKPEEKFGWLFVVSGQSLTNLQPDEDEVGELFHDILWAKGLGRGKPRPPYEPSEHAPWKHQALARLKHNPALADQIYSFVRRHTSHDQLKRLADGEYAFYASVGKKAVAAMPEELKLQILELGVHAAHEGRVHPIEAWKLDLFDTDRLTKDGSTFFKVARQIV